MTVKANQTILHYENWIQEHKTCSKGSQKLNTFILVSFFLTNYVEEHIHLNVQSHVQRLHIYNQAAHKKITEFLSLTDGK
jgi:hypothetical protein